jgi:hypothetical protein
MSDYFDRVEQGMREAVRRGAHVPWYARLRPRPSRPVAVVLACLLVTGSALAATGALRTGEPVGATVGAIPDADEGVTLPGSAHLLGLRVADPDGGPPWGLRVLRTTRGLMCLQVGRILDGRIGVLGQDGAFDNDGAFHPLSVNFLDGSGCGTEDARGDAFVNEQQHGTPASALTDDRRHVSGGCYTANPPSRSCPRSDLRDVYFGLLGPAAASITHLTPTGAIATTPTAGRDGAYLIVLPHTAMHCGAYQPFCGGSQRYSTGGPELEPSDVIRAVSYRGAPSCELPTPADLARRQGIDSTTFRAKLRASSPAIYRALYRDERYVRGSMNALTPSEIHTFETLRAPYIRALFRKCPAVGYVAAPAPQITPARLASAVSVHAEPARFYCEKRGEDIRPCDAGVPAGYKRIDMQGPPELLLVIEFTARVAVTNFASHYEINSSGPRDPTGPRCPVSGESGFGPTQKDLRAGQRVRFTRFVHPGCPGRAHITVGFVTVDGPSGAMPVPGLPGQSAEIPVGETNFLVP